MKCPICQTREPHHPLVCDADRVWLPTVLREIVEGYALLAVVEVIPATLDPEPGWSDPVAETLPAGTVWSGSRGAPVTGSREAPVPVPLDVVDLLGPARIPNPMRGPGWYPLSLWPEDQIGYLPVATELELWVIDWIGHRGQAEHRPEPTVASLAGWLADRIPDACDDHPAIDEFATDLRRIRAAIRRMAGTAGDRVNIGNCPTLLDDKVCGTKLSADPYVDRIRCPRCQVEWPRAKWLWLGSVIRDETA